VPDQALTALLGQGIAGVIAVLFIGLYLRELAEHKASKTTHNSELRTVLEKAAAEAKDVSGRAEYKTQELHRDYQEQLRELYEQMSALREAHSERERMALQTIEYFARQQVEAVEELAKLGELLRRAYERARRQ
jgi:hypothetical protein